MKPIFYKDHTTKNAFNIYTRACPLLTASKHIRKGSLELHSFPFALGHALPPPRKKVSRNRRYYKHVLLVLTLYYKRQTKVQLLYAQ